MINLERIKRDCFWDYNLSDNDIKRLATSTNEKENKFLFQKILLNSTSLFNDLKIFQEDLLIKLIKTHKISNFNSKLDFKRKNMAEAYFLNKQILVDELKWQI